MPTCPTHPDVLLEPKKKGWYCEECDQSVISYEAVPRPGEAPSTPVAAATPPSWPHDIDPATLPTWLAHPWAALCVEAHPRVRLHWLVDTAELAVRVTVALALAEVVAARGGSLPEAVADAIAEHVERPTLGRWLAILRTLGEAAPATPRATHGLFPCAREALAPRFLTEDHGGTLDTSLLVLRNQVAHGGGLGRERAKALVEAHLPVLAGLLRGLGEVLGDGHLLAEGVLLRGCSPAPASADLLGRLPAGASGPWLLAKDASLPLEPLLHHGAVVHVGTDGQLLTRPGGAVAQVYARGARDRLTYTPLGAEAAHSERFDAAAFRALFQLDRVSASRARNVASAGGFAWDDCLREARLQAEELVGRAEELRRAKDWLKSREPRGEGPRLGWISAGPGVGKSMLMARLAADYGGSAHRGLFYHRFRGGDARNGRGPFLRLLQAALLAWAPLAAVTEAPAEDAGEGRKLEEDVLARLQKVSALEAPNEKAPAPAFWVLVDGLDEAAGADPGLASLLRSLAVPGTVWLVAGRPEHGLDRAFAAPACEEVYPGGLPPMHAGDIRAMLLEGLGSGRYALLARDEEGSGDEVRNAFVEAVVTRAQGLPLYVHLLLEDLRSGQLDVRSEGRLPDGLTAYYDALVERLGISDAKRDLTQIVALLARVEDPLDAAGLALLLAGGRPERLERYVPRVEAALRAGSALLRRAPGPDTQDGWALYHQSFREYVGRAPALAGSVRDAEEALLDASGGWAALVDVRLTAVRNHLFRWGTTHALRWGGPEGVSAARGRLTDFAYLQARTGALPAAECAGLARAYAEVLAARGGPNADRELRLWEAFTRERVHLLARGDAEWPANRILLQLAVEHADDSPVTRAAEAWLETGACEWVWLRRAGGQRPEHVRETGCLAVLEGHTGLVSGVSVVREDLLLSWSADRTLRLWSTITWEPAGVLTGHSDWVAGALKLRDGRVVSWSHDGTLRVWDVATRACVAVLRGHDKWVLGAIELQDGRLLSWSEDHTLRLWDAESGAPGGVLTGHGCATTDAVELPDGIVASWSTWGSGSDKGVIHVWDTRTGALRHVLAGHTAGISGGLALPDGRLLSWSSDRSLRLWAPGTGVPLAVLARHTGAVTGALVLLDGRILSWGRDRTMRIWDGESGLLLAVHKSQVHLMRGARLLSGNRLLTWWGDVDLMVWDMVTGSVAATHASGPIGGIGNVVLSDGCVASWSNGSDPAVCVWDPVGGELYNRFIGHMNNIFGVFEMPQHRLVSWSHDRSIRVWDRSSIPRDEQQAPSTKFDVRGTLVLDAGRLLSWTSGGELFLLESRRGAKVGQFFGHTKDVVGVLVTSDGRWISWSWDHTVLLWDGLAARPQVVMEGHTKGVTGVLLLADGRILSWSNDATLRLWDGSTGACLGVLTGHSGDVRGAVELPDGRIVSWSGWYHDRSLRVWDGSDGTLLAVLEGHPDLPSGAAPLPWGALMSWSKQGALCEWDADTYGLLRATNTATARRDVPELYAAWHAVTQSTEDERPGYARGHAGFIRVQLGVRARKRFALWHSDHAWQWWVDHALTDGTVVARRDTSLAILHLHHGNRRISIEEAEALLTPPRT